MAEEKYDYRSSPLYQQWAEECGFNEELAQTESRIAKRIVALVEYVRRASLRSEESCLETLNFGRAMQLAAGIMNNVREVSDDAIIQTLDAIRSRSLQIEDSLRRAGAQISEDHNLGQLFSQRDRLRFGGE